MKYFDIVCDGPPGPTAGRFVEVDDDEGRSIDIGTWSQRPDGHWVLRIGTESVRLRAQKATSTDPERLEQLAVLADEELARGKSFYCLECGKHWRAKDDARCPDATCPFKLPA